MKTAKLAILLLSTVALVAPQLKTVIVLPSTGSSQQSAASPPNQYTITQIPDRPDYYSGPQAPLPQPLGPAPINNIYSGQPLPNQGGISIIPINNGITNQNCLQVGANGLCAQCAFRFFNANGYCQPVSNLCATWDSMSGACTSCIAGYTVAGSTCVQGGYNPNPYPPPPDYTNQAPIPPVSNSVSNCAQTGPTGACIQCSYRFYNSNGYCIAVSDQCNTWDLTTGACTSCYGGYSLTAGACVITSSQNTPTSPNSPNIPNCAQVDASGFCSQCSYRYYLTSGVCQPVNDQCNTWDSTYGSCTSCYSGYTLNAGTCVLGNGQNPTYPNNIQNCMQVGPNNLCTQCYYGYYIVSGYCQPVSTLCSTWDAVSGGCTSCYQGYQLQGSNCIQSAPPSVGSGAGNCTSYGANGLCSQCSYGFYLVSGYCNLVNPLCSTWDPNTGACTSCFQGYTLSGTTCTQSSAPGYPNNPPNYPNYPNYPNNNYPNNNYPNPYPNNPNPNYLNPPPPSPRYYPSNQS